MYPPANIGSLHVLFQDTLGREPAKEVRLEEHCDYK